MKLAAIYSHKKGTERVSRKYPQLLAEVTRAIECMDAQIHFDTESPKAIHSGIGFFWSISISQAFWEELFDKHAWKPVRVRCDFSTEYYEPGYKFKKPRRRIFRELDYVKDKLGVEFQFDAFSVTVTSVAAKMTILKNLGYIEAGIVILPVRAFADEMEPRIACFERVVWDLKNRGEADIDIPIMILGIDADPMS